MNRNKNKLLQVILAVLLVAATSAVLSDGFSKTYSVSFDQSESNQSESLPDVFKLTDSNGKITYSSSIADEFIQIEKMAIAIPPSDGYIEDARQRHDKLKTAAVELGEARKKREAQRDEKETKRLQRLALIKHSKPPIIYQQNIYISYPYRLRKTHLHGGHHQTKKPVHHPANAHRSSRLSLPASSFSPRFNR